MQLICDTPQLLRRPLLLGRCLVLHLTLRLAEEVTSLAPGLSNDIPGLIGGGLGNLTARVASMLPKVLRLAASGLNRRRLRRRVLVWRDVGTCLLGHSYPPF
jgi:hypothetical protein